MLHVSTLLGHPQATLIARNPAGHVARMGEKRNVYGILVGKPEYKRPLGRPKHRWVDYIKMDLEEIECNDMDWIDLA
jgi:hypothetical protein